MQAYTNTCMPMCVDVAPDVSQSQRKIGLLLPPPKELRLGNLKC